MNEKTKEELELEIYLLSSNIDVFSVCGGNARELDGLRNKLADYRFNLSLLTANEVIAAAKVNDQAGNRNV